MDVTLSAATGRTTGSRPSNRLRAGDRIPGVLYGLGKDPVTLDVDRRELRQALTTEAGLNAIITLDVGGSSELSIVKDLQRDPVRNEVIHVDFVRVDVNVEYEVEVPIVLEGEAKQVVAEDGVVDQHMYTLSVYAKPDAIPNELTVDISDLEIGDSIRVGDVSLPVGSRTEVDPEEAVVSASVTRAAIEEEEEAAEAELAEGEVPEAAEEGDGESESAEG